MSDAPPVTRAYLETEARVGVYRVAEPARRDVTVFDLDADAARTIDICLLARVREPRSEPVPGAELVVRPDGRQVIYQWQPIPDASTEGA